MSVAILESPNLKNLFAGTLTLEGGLIFPNAGASGATGGILDFYENHTMTSTVSGPWVTNQPTTINLVRVGEAVNLDILGISIGATGATGGVLLVQDNIPSPFRPSAGQTPIVCPVIAIDNNAAIPGQMSITTGGTITITKTPVSNFTATANAGFYNSGVCYNVL